MFYFPGILIKVGFWQSTHLIKVYLTEIIFLTVALKAGVYNSVDTN